MEKRKYLKISDINRAHIFFFKDNNSNLVSIKLLIKFFD